MKKKIILPYRLSPKIIKKSFSTRTGNFTGHHNGKGPSLPQILKVIEELGDAVFQKLHKIGSQYISSFPKNVLATYPSTYQEILNLFLFVDEKFIDDLGQMEQVLRDIQDNFIILQDSDVRQLPEVQEAYERARYAYYTIPLFLRHFPPPIKKNYDDWFTHQHNLKQTLKKLAQLEKLEQELIEINAPIIVTESYIKTKLELFMQKKHSLQNLEKILKKTLNELTDHFESIPPSP